MNRHEGNYKGKFQLKNRGYVYQKTLLINKTSR